MDLPADENKPGPSAPLVQASPGWRVQVVRVLTWLNLFTLPVMLHLFFFAKGIGLNLEGSPGEVAAAMFTWFWWIGTPLLAVTALFLNRGFAYRPGLWLNLLILAFWLVALSVFLVLLGIQAATE